MRYAVADMELARCPEQRSSRSRKRGVMRRTRGDRVCAITATCDHNSGTAHAQALMTGMAGSNSLTAPSCGTRMRAGERHGEPEENVHSFTFISESLV